MCSLNPWVRKPLAHHFVPLSDQKWPSSGSVLVILQSVRCIQCCIWAPTELDVSSYQSCKDQRDSLPPLPLIFFFFFVFLDPLQLYFDWVMQGHDMRMVDLRQHVWPHLYLYYSFLTEGPLKAITNLFGLCSNLYSSSNDTYMPRRLFSKIACKECGKSHKW